MARTISGFKNLTDVQLSQKNSATLIFTIKKDGYMFMEPSYLIY